jgi:hypothetical protein
MDGHDLLMDRPELCPVRPGQRFLRPLRQIIESMNQSLKAQLDLERYGGRSTGGVAARVLQRDPSR